MKLHLPKSLLVAVLACFVAPASWANNNVVTLNGTNNGANIDLTDVHDGNHSFIRAAGTQNGEGTAVTDSIGTLTLASGLEKVVIAGTWNSAGSYFERLNINTLTVGDGSGNINLQVGTEQGNNTGANNVVINNIEGNISGLTLNNKSSLTIVGTPHFSTGIALQLKDGTNLILNNAGEITMRTDADANATDGAIKAQSSGTLTIGSGTTVTFANSSQQGTAPVEGHVVVNGGGVLKLTGAKSQLGYDDGKLDTLTLAGTSADNIAKLDIQTTNNQHLSTNIYMNGHALIAGSTGVIETYNGSITATGTNNIIESKLSLNRALTIEVTNASDNLTISGNVTYNSNGYSMTKTGAGTLVFSGTNNVFQSQYIQNAGVTEVNGASMFEKGIALKGGEITVGAAATLKGTSTVAAGSTLTVTTAGQLTFENGGTLELTTASSVLDLSAINYADTNTDTANVQLVKLMNQTSGAGTVKLRGGSVIQTTDQHRDNVNLSTNYVVGTDSTASLTLTAWSKSKNEWRTWTVLNGGSITVGGGAGMLNVRAGQQLIIENGGKVNVGQLVLGHESGGHPGSVVMRGENSQLTVSHFYANADKHNTWNNVVNINGGTLTITGESAFVTKNGSYMDVSIVGGADSPVVLKTDSVDVLMSGATTSMGGGTLEIANVTVNSANSKTITIKDATLGSGIINNSKLALAGNITISDSYSYVIASMGEAEGSYSLGNGNGFYTSTDIQYELVGGTGENTLQDGVSATFGGNGVSLELAESGNVIFTVAGESTTREFFINNGSVDVAGSGSTTSTGAIKYLVGTGGTLNLTDGTLETSIIENNGAVNLAAAGSKLIVNTNNAASYLTNTTGNGTMELHKNVTMSGGGSVKFGGDLVISEGVSLTLGRANNVDGGKNNQVYPTDLTSLKALNLDGGTLNLYYVAPKIKSMTIKEGAVDSTIYIDDVWSDKLSAKADATRIDSLQLDANLSMETNWKSNVNIGVLSGNGNLTATQKNGVESSTSNLWIDGLDNYTGNITLSGKMALTLNIGENESLKATQLSKDSTSSITLTGSGVYDLGNTTSLGAGVTLSDNWEGIVRMSNVTMGPLNVDAYGNAHSYLELIGVNGWLQNESTAKLTGLILSKSEDGTLNGYTVTGSSQQTYNFNGKIKGDGDFTIATNSSDKGTFAFNGDLSEYAGGIKVETHAEGKTPTIDINLTGGGDIFAADANGGVHVDRGGVVNLNIGKAGETTNMRGAVINEGAGTLNVTVQGDTIFNADVDVSEMSLNQNATFNKTLKVSGDVTVTQGKSLHLEDKVSISGANGGSSTMKAVEMNNTAIKGTATDSTVNSSLIELKNATSYSIENTTFTDVKLTAAQNAIIQLQNVQGDAVLSGGNYVMQAVYDRAVEPMSTSGTPTLQYQVAGSWTVDNAQTATTITLTATPGADCGHQLGVYDLVFALNLDFTDEAAQPTTLDGWKALVTFGGEMATLLEEQQAGYTMSADDALTMQNPYVMYNYNAADNELIVTVSGLTVPEPTTATLSLLALAALAVRRRRASR